MKEFLVNAIKLFLSILIILFLEEYFFKVIALIGINIEKTNTISLIIYILEAILIYIIYNSELKSAFSKYQNKFANNILYSLISFIVIFMAMIITNYIVKLIANNLNSTYHGLSFINIFNEEFNFNLLITFIKSIIIIPFIKVCIFVLGINNLIKGKSSIVISGITYALYEGLSIGGSFGAVFIDCIDEFVLFMLLSFIYKKNSNIAFSIVTFILYELLSGLLLTKVIL